MQQQSMQSVREFRAQKREIIRELDVERKRVKKLEADLRAANREKVRYISELERNLAESQRTNLYRGQQLTLAHHQLTQARHQEGMRAQQVLQLNRDVSRATTQYAPPKTIQNTWNKGGCSSVVMFPSDTTFLTLPDEQQGGGGTSMPGVYGDLTMEKGVYYQQMTLKGSGYTLVGLVASEEDKEHWKYMNDWSGVQYLHMCTFHVESITMQVNMTKRIATVVVQEGPPHYGKSKVEWTGLPSKVWFACALKRCSTREAHLLPCLHWEELS
jgi:hypothetical protein